METSNKTTITVETIVNAPVKTVWDCWTAPKHITQWCHASDDWHAPYAENDLKEGGGFKTTMAAKDGSFQFDFEGLYTAVENEKNISYTLGDGRKVTVDSLSEGDATRIVETFDPENTHPMEMQRDGWQAILNNFKNYAESRA